MRSISSLIKVKGLDELVIGNWYSLELTDIAGGHEWYFKFHGVIGDVIMSSECYSFYSDGSLYRSINEYGRGLCVVDEVKPNTIISMRYGDVMRKVGKG